MTLSEFSAWALNQGTVCKTDGTFCGECKDCSTEITSQRKSHSGLCASCRQKRGYRLRQERKGLALTRNMDGQTAHKEYRGYMAMKSRCYSKSNDRYADYGGRGVTVCDRWLGLNGFTNFISDMGSRPEGYTLDRIDVDGNYELTNCRWASQREQGANRRNNSKYLGVYKEGNKWRASLYVQGKRIRKTFDELKDALEYRKELERKYPV